MKWLTYFVILLCSSNFAKGQFEAFLDIDPDTLTDEKTTIEKWTIIESRIRNLSDEVVKMVFPTLSEMMISLNISKSCFRDCAKLLLGLRKLNTWAVKFLDASTKSADGFLELQAPSLGSYDECVENKVYSGHHGKKKGKVMFQGKYCNINIRPYIRRQNVENILPGSMTVGVLDGAYSEESIFSELLKIGGLTYAAAVKAGLCVPSGCSTDDVNEMLGRASDYLGVSVKAKRCAIKEEKRYTPIMVVVMTIYSLAGFLMLLGTLMDTYCHYWKKDFVGTGIQILRAFSLISNFKKLTSPSSSSSTCCLNGIRFLSMSWVIAGHTLLINVATNRNIPSNFEDYKSAMAMQVMMNPNASVDTFFFLSGFLVCYVVTKLVKVQKQSFNLKLYVIHRLWRLIPAYAFVIGFQFLIPLTGSGPLFHEVLSPFTTFCQKNWWTNLLFINNFYRQEEMCLPHTWFIAVDTQLYLLALVILLPLMRWPKVGVCLAVIVIAGCTLAAGVISYMKNMLAIIFLGVSGEEFSYFHNYQNINPYLHAPPYCIGLLLGYLLAMRSDFKVPKVLQVFGWSVSTATCLAIVYGVRNWYTGVPPTLWEKTIYSALCRPAWTLGVAWVTFCCCTGRGGVVNYILSWEIWTPLSKLTYVAYLVHIPVVLAYTANMRATLRLDYYLFVWIFLGNLFITYAVAFAGSMLIEAPFLSLEKLVFFRGHAKKGALPAPKELRIMEKDLEKNDVDKDKTPRKNSPGKNTGSHNGDSTHISSTD